MFKIVMKTVSTLGIMVTGFFALLFAWNSMTGGSEIAAGLALLPAALVFGVVYIVEHKST